MTNALALPPGARPILSAGRNCWTADAALDSAGLLIDARAYYRAFYHAARQARRYVLLAGWRFESELASVALDARFRGYFGTEELKTFFELGIFAPVYPRRSIGPRVGLGLVYDFGRGTGAYAGVDFVSGVGQMRLTSFEASLGGQLRWE